MSSKINEIINEIEEMKLKLREEIARQEREIGYEIRDGYVQFEKEVLVQQRENMKTLLHYFIEVPLSHLLASPLIYAMVIPALIFDIILFIYQQVVFRVYRFKFVKRSDYIVYDRHYLGYLNPIEKLSCLFCSYFNGLMQYASALAARTELYFCPIKHAKKIAYEHEHYNKFLLYGDEDAYQKKLEVLRENFLGK